MTEVRFDDEPGRASWFGDLDWGAIIASVVAGFGITILLSTFGAAAGIEAADEGGDGQIAASVGTWTVISAILGTLVGTFIGGRFSRWQSPGSSVYHAVTSWGLATVVGALLGAVGALGVLGAALRRADVTARDVAGAGDEISWGGWALWFGLLLTLAAAVAGWWLGARARVTDVERDTPAGYGARAGFAADPTTTSAARTTPDEAREEERPSTWTGT